MYKFIFMPGIEVVNLMFGVEESCWASWRFLEEEEIPSLKYTNEETGSYVKTGARIHLYGYLDRLGERALYYDTDSLIYVQRENEPPLVPTGFRLGTMTSELKPGKYIGEFVSGGPKNYACTIYDSVTRQPVDTVCKVRGITLKYSTSKQVNFDVIKDMILGDEKGREDGGW